MRQPTTKKAIKIGYIPTKRDCFNHPEANEYRDKVLEKVKTFGIEIVEMDKSTNKDGMLQYVSDIPKVVEQMKAAGVDGLFFPHCNFGAESMVARVASDLGKPVLLWGPRDNIPAPNDGRTRDTQCGLFATGKVLRRFNLPFTYLVNSWLDDDGFAFGFKSFAAVCAVVRDFKNTRVLQISTRPEPFWTVMYNEGELLEKYGLEVFPVTFPDVQVYIEKLEQEDSAAVKAAVQDIKQRMDCCAVSENELLRMARLRIAVKDLCTIHGCNSVAIQCWGPLHKAVGSCACTINGILTEEGLPVACETDVHGAVTSILLQSAAMNTKAIFFADLTIRHPENENAELLWHCGNFAPSLALDSRKRPLTVIEDEFGRSASLSNWEIQHGEVTVCRFDGDHGNYQLMIGEGKGVDGPQTTGTYSWFETQNWPKWEKHLVEGPYIHHCAGVHGRYAHVLYEACKYLAIQADPIYPTAEQLEARWLGQA